MKQNLADLLLPNTLPPLQKGQPDWLSDLRKDALTFAHQNGLPNKRLEDWKYTNFPVPNLNDLIPNFSEHSLNIIAHRNDADVVITSLTSLNKRHASLLSDKILPLLQTRHDFNLQSVVALNQAYSSDTTIIYIPENYHCKYPITINAPLSSTTTYQQLCIILDRNSSATFIEQLATAPSSQGHTNFVSYLHVGEGGQLNHYRTQTQSLESTLIYSLYADLKTHANYRHFTLNLGSAITHQSMHIHLSEPHSYCDIRGITLAKNSQHIDIHLPIIHHTHSAYSNQHFKTVLKDSASSVFYGGVRADSHCAKTEAHQLCNMMLIGEKSQGYLRPELDILTDDVVCSHGATIGGLDAEALYYLNARGLDEIQSKQLLLEAFVTSVIEDNIPENIASHIQQLIQRWGI